MTKVEITFHDKKEDKNIIVDICPFKDGEYLRGTELYGESMFHVLVDEGYLKTNYYYPMERYVVISVKVIKE